ncbi:ABC-type transport system substrate-binding protein [Bradyrhizobium sp. JR6.1]
MTMTTRREAMALISAALAGTTLGGSAFAQAAPKKGVTLRISAPANPSSLDPATGGAGSDHAFLFTMYDTLTEWEVRDAEAEAGACGELEVHRSQHAGAQHPLRRHFP